MRDRAGPVSEISVFGTEMSVTWMKKLQHVVWVEIFLTDFLSSQNVAPKMAWFWSFMFFHISSMRISFICESARVHDAIRVTHHLSLCSTILVLLFEFVPVGRAEILYMNTPQYSSR